MFLSAERLALGPLVSLSHKAKMSSFQLVNILFLQKKRYQSSWCKCRGFEGSSGDARVWESKEIFRFLLYIHASNRVSKKVTKWICSLPILS
jgi:hypothetical protein